MTKKQIELKTVTISKKRYEELLEKERELDALRGAGVDNWEGYGGAMREAHGEEDPWA